MISEKRIPEASPLEDESLTDYYSRMAKRYMGFPVKRVLSRIRARGVERGLALDVGTGPGVFPLWIARSLPEIEFLAIDLSPAMVKVAQANAKEIGLEDRVHFQLGSAYALPLKDKTIDLVICVNTLHHLEDPLPFFNEVARVLKEGGRFVMVDLRRDAPKSLAIFFDLLWRLMIREEKARDGLWNSLKASFTLEECNRLLRRSALQAWRIYPQAIEMWIESY
ncbi:MAG: class I SAM-dependent methyltransferase [Deltaproteobacteria bacterium]|nr:class I SAM-dependent methyltransferase [Deltaproteobacteria bacterium]